MSAGASRTRHARAARPDARRRAARGAVGHARPAGRSLALRRRRRGAQPAVPPVELPREVARPRRRRRVERRHISRRRQGDLRRRHDGRCASAASGSASASGSARRRTTRSSPSSCGGRGSSTGSTPRSSSGPGAALSSFAAWVVDHRIIDGSVNGVATLVRDGGGRLRKLQTGYVRNYALGIAAGTVAILAYVVVRAGLRCSPPPRAVPAPHRHHPAAARCGARRRPHPARQDRADQARRRRRRGRDRSADRLPHLRLRHRYGRVPVRDQAHLDLELRDLLAPRRRRDQPVPRPAVRSAVPSRHGRADDPRQREELSGLDARSSRPAASAASCRSTCSCSSCSSS